jgi:hypothetical protein
MGKHNKLHKRFYKSLFYIVLDSFVETVHFVNEQDGLPTLTLVEFGPLDSLPYLFHPGQYC